MQGTDEEVIYEAVSEYFGSFVDHSLYFDASVIFAAFEMSSHVAVFLNELADGVFYFFDVRSPLADHDELRFLVWVIYLRVDDEGEGEFSMWQDVGVDEGSEDIVFVKLLYFFVPFCFEIFEEWRHYGVFVEFVDAGFFELSF